ncbi:MAG: hypothetical protein IJ656_01560 [Bacilli bacterium]|nr:hypothetical protein [Bacilli bacterium]
MKKIGRKLLVVLCPVSIISLVGLGFSTWAVATQATNNMTVDLSVGDVITGGTGEALDVITISSLGNFEYATGYGFVNDGIYADNVDLTGTCLVNTANAKSCFTSYRNTKSFKLDVSLSTALPNGLNPNGFSSSSMSLTSTNFSVNDTDPVDGEAITTSFVITCTNTDADFSFDFSLNLKWTGSLSSFPNLASANFNITFTPKENA